MTGAVTENGSTQDKERDEEETVSRQHLFSLTANSIKWDTRFSLTFSFVSNRLVCVVLSSLSFFYLVSQRIPGVMLQQPIFFDVRDIRQERDI